MFRNIPEDETIEIYWNTVTAAGAPVAPSSAFTTADIAIYKDGSATQKTTTNGLTVTSPFDSATGSHLLVINTSNDTGDPGFWAAGSRYEVKLSTAKTVDSISVDGRSLPRGSFGIESEYQGAKVTHWNGVALATTNPLPNAAPNEAGGLPISDAGGLDLDDKLAATNEVTAARMGALTDWINGGRLDVILDAITLATGTTIPSLISAVNAGAARYIAILTPAGYEIPNTGTVTVPIEIRCFDDDGDAVDLDAAADPTVSIFRASDETDLSASLSAITNPGLGIWRLTYTVDAADAVEPLRIDASGTISAVSRSTSAYPTVTDAVAVDYTAADRARDDAIKAFVDASTAQTADNNVILSDGDHGNAALKTLIDAISSSAIADAVWDEALAGHVVAGSAAVALSAAGGAADPLLNEVPGSYVAGTAGYVIGSLSGATVTVTGYANLDSDGVLHLKEGGTNVITFTGGAADIVSDLTSAKVFLAVRDSGGRLVMQVEGAVTTPTGTQVVTFSPSADEAMGLTEGRHTFEVTAIYGYAAGPPVSYTGLEVFTSGPCQVDRLELDTAAI